MESSQFCTFWLGDMFLGIDVHQVQEVMRPQDMTVVPLVSDNIGGLINLRGQIVTAVDLRERLELPPRGDDQPPMNIVVRSDGDVVSLLVDRIGDVLEVDVTAFEPPPPTLTGACREVINRVNKLDDALLCVLDIPSVLRFTATTSAKD